MLYSEEEIQVRRELAQKLETEDGTRLFQDGAVQEIDDD